jgi:hypothetical protein
MMIHRALRLVTAVSVTFAALGSRGTGQEPTPANDGKHEITISGCLLRSGYAGYQIEEAQVDAIDGRPVASPAEASTRADQAATPKKWILDGGGNLGGRTGEKVQVVGRTDWQPALSDADEPPNRTPHVEVKSVKTIASSCR